MTSVIVHQALAILGVLIVFGTLLGILREDWFSSFLLIVAFVIAIPIVILMKVVSATFAVVHLFWGLLRIFLRRVTKSVVYIAISIPLTLVFVVTYFVPHIGKHIQNIDGWLKQFIDTSGLVSECRYSRRMIVEIVAEQDDRSPEYDSENRYQEELGQVRETGKDRLSGGEQVLSLFIGGSLLITQVYGLQLNRPSFYGFTAGLVIQIGLFIIAVSILYRVSILDFLAFSDDE